MGARAFRCESRGERRSSGASRRCSSSSGIVVDISIWIQCAGSSAQKLRCQADRPCSKSVAVVVVGDNNGTSAPRYGSLSQRIILDSNLNGNALKFTYASNSSRSVDAFGVRRSNAFRTSQQPEQRAAIGAARSFAAAAVARSLPTAPCSRLEQTGRLFRATSSLVAALDTESPAVLFRIGADCVRGQR